jgi:hypothetical protein
MAADAIPLQRAGSPEEIIEQRVPRIRRFFVHHRRGDQVDGGATDRPCQILTLHHDGRVDCEVITAAAPALAGGVGSPKT